MMINGERHGVQGEPATKTTSQSALKGKLSVMKQRSPFVVVPYTNEASLSPALVTALELEGIAATYSCTGAYREDYWNLFENLWTAGSTFIIVEQDNVPFPGALQTLWDCSYGWCVHEYLIHGSYRWALGCVKFGAMFSVQYPDLMDEAYSGRMWADYNSRDWWELDVRVNQTLLRLYGVEPHIHQPAVLHLNPKHLEA